MSGSHSHPQCCSFASCFIWVRGLLQLCSPTPMYRSTNSHTTLITIKWNHSTQKCPGGIIHDYYCSPTHALLSTTWVPPNSFLPNIYNHLFISYRVLKTYLRRLFQLNSHKYPFSINTLGPKSFGLPSFQPRFLSYGVFEPYAHLLLLAQSTKLI